MNDLPPFEKVVERLLVQAGFAQKLLIGGLLCFVPIVNFFAFGYLSRFSQSVRSRGSFQLPPWGDWRELFLEGCLFFVVLLIFAGAPLLLGATFYWALASVGFGALAYLFFSAAIFVSPALFSAAWYRYQTRQQLADLLDVSTIVRLVCSQALYLIVPSLVLVGLFALGWPIYGFAFFAGLLFLIAYTSVLYRLLESRSARGVNS